jgi:hypothetical protein
MKKILSLLTIAALFLIGCGGGAPVTQNAQRIEDDPFPVLRGYGNWIDVAPYGRVWQPIGSSDWRPYFNGQWIWTDRGWMWDSDEPYGWVVYHYGYWTTMGAVGWVWVPDYEWAPARVRWYVDRDYIGWAPIPPPNSLFPLAYEPGAENIWVIVEARQFVQRDVGRLRSHISLRPPPPDRAAGFGHAPDIRNVELTGNQQIPVRKTEKSDVRHGQRVLTRVGIRTAEVQHPAPPSQPPPAAQPVPPPIVKPAPVTPSPAKPATPTPGRPATGRKSTRPPTPSGGAPTPVVITPSPAKETPKDSVREKKPSPAQPARPPRTKGK